MDPAAEEYRGLSRRRRLHDADDVDLRTPPDGPDFTGMTGFEQLEFLL